jgi:hypothetical protein
VSSFYCRYLQSWMIYNVCFKKLLGVFCNPFSVTFLLMCGHPCFELFGTGDVLIFPCSKKKDSGFMQSWSQFFYIYLEHQIYHHFVHPVL